MPLLDHFHRPLLGQRHWEGVHHFWASAIAQQLNLETLPREYFAEPEISLGPEMEIDVATLEVLRSGGKGKKKAKPKVEWAPAPPKMTVSVSYANLDKCEIRVYQDLGGNELRAAIELVSPANKDRKTSREAFAAKCADYIRHGIGLIIVDVVTSLSANLHAEIFKMLEVKSGEPVWSTPTGLYAVAYRPVTVRKRPRVEVWPETLTLGEALPVMPLWLNLELCVPVRLEDSYLTTCRSLRISA